MRGCADAHFDNHRCARVRRQRGQNLEACQRICCTFDAVLHAWRVGGRGVGVTSRIWSLMSVKMRGRGLAADAIDDMLMPSADKSLQRML